jgi:hypothetical protein
MLTYKEFYVWLDGFMTNRDWTTIKQVDIETIQGKMKKVNNTDPFFPNPRTMVSPIQIPIPHNPFKEDGYDDLGSPPKIIM